MFIDAVVGALVRGKFLEIFGGDAGAVEQGAIGPGGVAVHAAEKNALVGVGAGAEVFVESVGMGPEFQRKAEDLKNVAVHASARLFSFCDEGRQLAEGFDFLTGIGGDEAESRRR